MYSIFQTSDKVKYVSFMGEIGAEDKSEPSRETVNLSKVDNVTLRRLCKKMSVPELAEHFEVREATVKKALAKFGLEAVAYRLPRTTMDDMDIPAIKVMHKTMGIEAIAHRLDISPSAVARALRA